jgi:MinD superfamily P-loop ATPase
VKELIVLSGKGGTGKTAVASAFAYLTHVDSDFSGAVFVDADVDASNLELLIGSSPLEEHEFQGGHVADIDPESCIACGICQDVCRFDAVRFLECTEEFGVDHLGCEGCAACFYQCPVEAISMVPCLAGHWFRSESRFGPFFHARLRPAQENSGKLVALVKERAKEATADEDRPLMIVDGPSGIACPAIAAVTGADLVLIVAEPTVAGLHDLERVGRLAAHFRVEAVVSINKTDLYAEGAERIKDRCRALGLRVLGSVPFDEAVTQALVEGRPVTEYRPESVASQALENLWEDVKQVLDEV